MRLCLGGVAPLKVLPVNGLGVICCLLSMILVRTYIRVCLPLLLPRVLRLAIPLEDVFEFASL